MRTEPSSPLATLPARLRVGSGRVRRWLATRGPLTRTTLLVVGLATLLGLGYLSTPERATPGINWTWLYENRHLSRDDVARIRETLEAQGITSILDRSGRVGVKPEQRVAALAALGKSKVVPPTLDELAERAAGSQSIFEGADERARRDHVQLEQSAKVQIEALDDAIDSAFVRINRVRTGHGFRSGEAVSGYVHLRVDDNRKLPHAKIEGIQAILTGLVPELKPEAITVIDQKGRTYLAAGNRELKDQITSRVREDGWRDAITEGLRHIPGVEVRVQLELPPAPAPVPVAPPPVAIAATPVESAGTSDVARPNAPVAVEPDPAPVEIVASIAPTPPVPTRPKANVYVRVPLSFYLLTFEARSPNRRPRPDELKASEATTKETVTHVVRSVIQGEDLGRIEVFPVQDDLTLGPLAAESIAIETRSDLAWPVLWGAVGVMVIVSSLMAFHLVVVARRPAPRVATPDRRADFASDADEGTAPAPTERIRELIRLDPEAAAGALQRWIGSGEAAG